MTENKKHFINCEQLYASWTTKYYLDSSLRPLLKKYHLESFQKKIWIEVTHIFLFLRMARDKKAFHSFSAFFFYPSWTPPKIIWTPFDTSFYKKTFGQRFSSYFSIYIQLKTKMHYINFEYLYSLSQKYLGSSTFCLTELKKNTNILDLDIYIKHSFYYDIVNFKHIFI